MRHRSQQAPAAARGGEAVGEPAESPADEWDDQQFEITVLVRAASASNA